MKPIIMSGGSGTRMWPISRESFPKQFADLLDESLQLKTIKRLLNVGSPWVITVQALKVLTDKILAENSIDTAQALYEPMPRNTAPAIALLCRYFELKGFAQEVVGVFAADHLIENEKAFFNCLKLAEECAKEGQVVTLGIKPDHPATGYGYIQTTDKVAFEGHHHKAYKVLGFKEKPNLETAQKFLKAGGYNWNSGMFVFKVAVMIAHFKNLMPELWQQMQALKIDLSNLSEIYQKLTPQSIDFGIMEKLAEQVSIPCDIGWNDVGSWDEIAKIGKDKNKVEFEAQNNFVKNYRDKKYAFVNVDDLIVVDSADVTLVCKKGKTQNIKKIVEQLQKQQPQLVKDHVFDHRPWGSYEILRDTEQFKSKVIHVLPGKQLSYQSHKKRAEHWVVIQGQPEVTLDDKILKLNPGDHVFIPKGAKHRMRNPSRTETVEFVEVQVGEYFGEDDITRYQDDYGRT